MRLRSSLSHMNAEAASASGSDFLISLIRPVVGSTTRTRTKCPPSFLSQTPGTVVGASQFFHRNTHFFSFMRVSLIERRTQAVRRHFSSRRLPSQVAIEVF